jgi:acyl-CoA synthetase (AMP-forming)/AMP-acid ligase II
VSSPLFHVASWMSLIPTFLWGGRLVIAPTSDPLTMCRLISEERCTSAFVVQPTYDEISSLENLHSYDLSSFRSHFREGEWGKKTTQDPSRWGRRPGGYGQTEVTGVAGFFALSEEGERGMRTSPVVEHRIVDANGHVVLQDGVGELELRGPIVGMGYWNRPELNSERNHEGWWRTNDLGQQYDDGTFSFVGPKSRIIKSGFENIYPAEVEAAIRSHRAVLEAAVIGVPDERWAQSVKAIVVAREGADVSSEQIIAHCQTRIASYKKPKFVQFVTGSLPKKGFSLDYDLLDELYGGGGYPGS